MAKQEEPVRGTMLAQAPTPAALRHQVPGGLTRHPLGTGRGRAPATAALGRGQGEGLGPHPGTFYSWLLSTKESVMCRVNHRAG